MDFFMTGMGSQNRRDREHLAGLFFKKQSLPFPILSDPEHRIAEAYGVWVEKSMYGKTYMGTERATFVIGPDEHLKQVMALLCVPGGGNSWGRRKTCSGAEQGVPSLTRSGYRQGRVARRD
jgi:AhpC/TSA family